MSIHRIAEDFFQQIRPIEINTDKSSFWNSCRELIRSEIGAWLKSEGHAPWEKGNSPKFKMKMISRGEFQLISD